jgi:hypothetical protein
MRSSELSWGSHLDFTGGVPGPVMGLGGGGFGDGSNGSGGGVANGGAPVGTDGLSVLPQVCNPQGECISALLAQNESPNETALERILGPASVSLGVGGTWVFRGFGIAGQATVGVDTKYQMCFQWTPMGCARAGGGSSGGGGLVVDLQKETFQEGWEVEVGMWAEGGAGKLAGASVNGECRFGRGKHRYQDPQLCRRRSIGWRRSLSGRDLLHKSKVECDQ